MNKPLIYDIGSRVLFEGRSAIVTAQIEVDEVIVQFKDTGETKAANIVQLNSVTSEPTPPARTLDAIHDEDMNIARERLAAIEPLLEIKHGKGKALETRSSETGTPVRTLRRWRDDYLARRRLTDLAPYRREKRRNRIPKKTESIIQDVIKNYYLTKQKRSAKKTIEEVIRRCKAAKLKPPHPNTVRNRIASISEKEKVSQRKGKKAAHDQFGEIKGEYPDGNFPLETVQIDHTELDIELVDDETCQPIGRPWLTVAIDVYSRMITGYYISLDAPSAFSVGMCIRHSTLPKDEDLEKIDIEGKWPVWGLMKTLHADNGKDFRSELIQKACDQYHITIAWRPVRKPYFGGHIERLMGTIGTEIHDLPGTTFSNVREKGEYNSEKQAILTLDELEKWFATFIVGNYHQRMHKGIGMSPLEKWREGILGTKRKKGTGILPEIEDSESFKIDFLPFDTRTVERSGISWDGITYYAPSISHWIKAKKGGQSAKFTIRRDPRDISHIYFLDPELKKYLRIPYRDMSHPSVSLWELSAAKRELSRRNVDTVDEDVIFSAIEEMRRIAENAAATTKHARRQNQKKKQNAQGKPEPKQVIELVVDNSKDEPDDEGEFDISDEELDTGWEEWS